MAQQGVWMGESVYLFLIGPLAEGRFWQVSRVVMNKTIYDLVVLLRSL